MKPLTNIPSWKWYIRFKRDGLSMYQKPLYHQDQDTSFCRMLKAWWHGWNYLGEALVLPPYLCMQSSRAIVIVYLCLQKYVGFVALLSPITQRNLREMLNDAQALAYGILAWFWNTCICAHKYIYELCSSFLAAISRHIESSNKYMQQMW